MSLDIGPFLGGAAVNLAAALLIVAGIYYPRSRNRDYFFSFVAFNTVIYIVMALLTRVELGIGVGFGLFAIFSVLRYRTEATSFREMTYMFVIIALPVVNAVLIPAGNLTLALVADGLVITVVFCLERGFGLHFEVRQRVRYERLELITPERRDELIADLRQRTGLPVERVEIGRIDLVTDVADLFVVYPEQRETRRGRERLVSGRTSSRQLS